MMNLTVRQENEALGVLRELVRRAKDMLPGISITLWDNTPRGISWGGEWQALKLNNRGLQAESGYKDACTSLICECLNDHQDRSDRPHNLRPSTKVVREYQLTATCLRKKLAKLR